MKQFLKKILACFYKIRFSIDLGKYVQIAKGCLFLGKRNIHIKNGCIVRSDCLFATTKTGSICIEEDCDIGARCRISGSNVHFEREVLIGPNVFISGNDHEYRDISLSVMKNGSRKLGHIYVGEGSFIGSNSVVVGNVRIGKHSLVGANSVLKKDVPDYTIVAGNPAKIVKKYDFETKKWIRV